MNKQGLSQFCRLELGKREVEEAYELAARPHRLRAAVLHEDLIRYLRDSGTPWFRLQDGTFLRCTKFNHQLPLNEDTLINAVERVLRDTTEAQVAGQFNDVLRELRTTQGFRVKLEVKLPVRASAESMPSDLEAMVLEWDACRQTIERLRAEKARKLLPLTEEREGVLHGGGDVHSFLASLPADGLAVTIQGRNMLVKHYFATRRRPVLEKHIKAVLAEEVAGLLNKHEEPAVVARWFAERVMTRVREVAGSETTEVFTLLDAERGQKRKEI